MWQEAWDQLEEIAPEQRHHLEVVRLRIHILLALERWDSAAVLAESLITKGVRDGGIYLNAAYAVRRARSLLEANELLLRGEAILEKDAMFHFNLACYACQLGDLEGAKMRLGKAVEIDETWRAKALDDSDLEPLWESLSSRLG
jgi:hypothetical protein